MTAGPSDVEIREERPDDVRAVRDVNREAFGRGDEACLVDALREGGGVTLALVAVSGDAVVGHILFSPLVVGESVGAALAPMAVRPRFQRRGIGSRLVTRGLEELRRRGCPYVVVLGHPAFYPRFGFEPAGPLGVTCEWSVPAEAFLVRVLEPQVRDGLGGRAVYRPEFSLVT